MHGNRNAARAARHSHRRQNLDERGLFDIPIVGPILSGILGGGKHTTAASKPTTANNPPAQATTTAAQAPPAQQSSPANNGGGAATSVDSGNSGNGGNTGGTTAANTGDGGAASPTGGDSGTSAAAGGGAVGVAAGGATSQAPPAPLPSGAIVGSTTGADGRVTPLATGTNGVVVPVETGSDGLYTPITTATAVMGGGTIHNTGSSPTGSANPSVSAESSNLAKKGLSGGAIAGILIPILLVLGVITFFVLRRRSKSRRAQGSDNHWWFGKARQDSDNESNHSKSSLRSGKSAAERAKINSMRSSFGTNIDHGAIVPTSPPAMAEVSRQRSFGHAGETLMQGTTPRSANFTKLTIPPSSYRPPNDNEYDPVPETPMSVRPFSPSETFAFPKPPAPASDGRGSPPTRSITPKSGGFYTSRFSGQSSDSTNPSSVAQTYNPIAESHTSSITEESSGSSAEGTLATAHEFQPVETVRRPFLPTLDDELTVEPGDSVRIVKAFDDGWCFCEKEEGLGAGSRGLIPIDCLREAGQSLPAFLASKRVSSNYATWAIADQLQTISEASA